MKKTLITLTLLITLLIGCTLDPWKDKELSFKEGFEEINKTDNKFNTNFHDERIKVTMVPLKDIDNLIEELKELRENIKKTKDSPDKGALLDFINVRIFMLISEKNFQLAQEIGDIGLVGDEAGFRCSEVPYILEATAYYNKSRTYGIKALNGLDTILYEHREVKGLQDIIGLNENKTWFYYSPFDEVKNIVRTNSESINKICRSKVVTK